MTIKQEIEFYDFHHVSFVSFADISDVIKANSFLVNDKLTFSNCILHA